MRSPLRSMPARRASVDPDRPSRARCPISSSWAATRRARYGARRARRARPVGAHDRGRQPRRRRGGARAANATSRRCISSIRQAASTTRISCGRDSRWCAAGSACRGSCTGRGDARFDGRSAAGGGGGRARRSSCLMVNRNAGAGTRVLIDKLLARRAAAGLRQPAALAQRGRGRGRAGPRRLGRRDRAGGAALRPRLPAAGARALRFPPGREPPRPARRAGLPGGARRTTRCGRASARLACSRRRLSCRDCR